MSDGARPPETEEPAAGGGPPPGWPTAPQNPFAAGKTLHGEPAAFGPAFPTPDAGAAVMPAPVMPADVMPAADPVNGGLPDAFAATSDASALPPPPGALPPA